jgi:GNAT superfamily N-acetyltransferase
VPNRAHLVSQSTVDKNGRLTTVHVNPDKRSVNVSAPRTSGLTAAPSRPETDPKAVLLAQKVTTEECIGHTPHGCKNKNCPKGLSKDWAKKQIAKDADLQAQLASHGITEVDGRNVYGYKTDGWGEWDVQQKNGKQKAALRIPLNRPYLAEEVADIDKSITPSFKSMKELTHFAHELYGDNMLFITDQRPAGVIYVVDLFIDADLRGLGVGGHIMRMIEKYADEHEQVITLSPTEGGDGSLARDTVNEDAFQKNRREHQAKIWSFYERYGFERNLAFAGYAEDFVNGGQAKGDDSFIQSLEPNYMSNVNLGVMVRYPNGEKPARIFE